jgi:YVTN family beta-propeller protein
MPLNSNVVPFPSTQSSIPRRLRLAATLALAALTLSGCRRHRFPVYPDTYHEFAYVTDGASGTVSVLDLIDLRLDRALTVGKNPSGLAASPTRNEVYAVNTDSGTVSVINTALNRVEATIGVHARPYFITVAPDGKRAYVPNSASNTVSVLDLDTRREIAAVATGVGPGVARVDPGNRTLIVTNRIAGSVSLYTINHDPRHPLTFREAFDGCPGATDALIRLDDPGDPASGGKAFVACSAGHQVLAVWLQSQPSSWRAAHDPATLHDARLALLDVGQTPVHLTVNPDDGNLFVTNFASGSLSEISSYTDEVIGTDMVGNQPSRSVLSKDGATLWITDFGADSATAYSVDDSRVAVSVHTGSHPDALAFSADQHILLIADAGSSDVAVIRTQSNVTPALVTLLPAGSQPNDIVIKAFTAK